MAVEQTSQSHRCFEKKERKKGHGYCSIHRIDAHDLTDCKVVRDIIDNELRERKSRADEDGEDGANPDQLALGYQ